MEARQLVGRKGGQWGKTTPGYCPGILKSLRRRHKYVKTRIALARKPAFAWEIPLCQQKHTHIPQA